MNQNISAGAKDVIGNQLSSAYDISAAQSQYNLAANLQSIYDKYYKTVSTADETLADQFGISDQIKTTSKGLQYLNKYISESNEYRQLWDNFRKLYKSDAAADEAMQSALFQTTGEGAETTTGLSDLGKNVLASLIHRGATFGEDENRQAYGDIYDYLYKTNQDAYNLFAEQPGLLDEFLELDTKNSVQQKFGKDMARETAVTGWFNKNADRYGVTQIRKADKSAYGKPSADNLGSGLYEDVPNDTSFIGDIDLTQIKGAGSKIYYDNATNSYIIEHTYKPGDRSKRAKNAKKWIDDTANSLGVQLKIYSASSGLGSGGKRTIKYSISADDLKQRALYKDSSGNIHVYPKNKTNKED